MAGDDGKDGPVGGSAQDMGRQDTGLTVLYEDEYLIAVDKPAGIIVHGDGTGARTLADMVREMILAREDAGDAGADSDADAAPGTNAVIDELQPLQRLDRDTTGIVLFSKRKDTQAEFDGMLSGRKVSKEYLAIVHGRFPTGVQTYDGPIGRDRHDSHRMRVSRTGKEALTKARRLDYRKDGGNLTGCSLLSVRIFTGRKHQIRVHLSHAGFPVLGDGLYSGGNGSDGRRSGKSGNGSGTGRDAAGLMLHAWRVGFEHPVTGEHVCIVAPYPQRFAALFPEPEDGR